VIAVHDGVLADPAAYRRAALALPFQSVDVGQVFHGIAPCLDPTVPQWLEATYPDLVVTLTFFRQSPAGQIEPNDVHTDGDMGDVTALLYLTPDPPPGDGTAFWADPASGRRWSDTPVVGAAGANRDAWHCWRTVLARCNRAVVFDAPLFHSRALHANYGQGDDARLIQVLFARRRG